MTSDIHSTFTAFRHAGPFVQPLPTKAMKTRAGILASLPFAKKDVKTLTSTDNLRVAGLFITEHPPSRSESSYEDIEFLYVGGKGEKTRNSSGPGSSSSRKGNAPHEESEVSIFERSRAHTERITLEYHWELSEKRIYQNNLLSPQSTDVKANSHQPGYDIVTKRTIHLLAFPLSGALERRS